LFVRLPATKDRCSLEIAACFFFSGWL